MANLNYTTIHHRTRKSLGLSVNEYMIADLIYNLQNNQKSKYPGWCYATRDYMADFFGLSRNGIQKIIGRLILLGLVERGENNKTLKTSQEWYEKVVAINENDDRIQSGHEVHTTYADSAYKVVTKPGYDNYIDNTNDNSIAKLGEPSVSNVKVNPRPAAEPHKTIGYLKLVPEEDLKHFEEKFKNLDRETIIREVGRAKAWLESTGRRYKDYRAFLRNWLDRKDEDLAKRKGAGNGRVSFH